MLWPQNIFDMSYTSCLIITALENQKTVFKGSFLFANVLLSSSFAYAYVCE